MIQVFDMQGKEVFHIVSDKQIAGERLIQWNGNDFNGYSCPLGEYLIIIKKGNKIASGKVLKM